MEAYFTKELEYQGIAVRYSRSPSLRHGNEIHAHHELIYYLDGDATLLSEGVEKRLSPKTLLLVPAGCYHHLRIVHQARYTRLTVQFHHLAVLDGVMDGQSNILVCEQTAATDFADAMIASLEQAPCVGRELAVYAAFLSLMAALARGEASVIPPRAEQDVVSRCLSYLDAHFTERVTVAELAKHCYVSESTVFALFRQALGVSVHRYLTQKRMIYAKRLLESGKRPTEIYAQCGYLDYSTFYKAYVKRFSKSPKEEKKE